MFTYGAPRVGNRRYVNYVRLDFFRWVNNNDIVPRVPPTWMGYRHTGQEIYLDALGKIRRVTGWQRLKDRLRGLILGLQKGRLDPLSDHSLNEYIRHIRCAIDQGEAGGRGSAAPHFTASEVPLPQNIRAASAG